MGTFAGHAYIGIFLCIGGLLWCFLAIQTHLITSNKRKGKKSKFASNDIPVGSEELFERSWLPLSCCPNFPFEPMIKIILPFIAIIIETLIENNHHRYSFSIFHVYDNEGKLRDQGRLHHITMHIAFIISGTVDILTMFIKFPRHTSKLFLSLAFAIEFILIYLHTAGRSEINIEAHSILEFTIFMCLIFSLLRIASSLSIVINLGFGSCIFLQGTWMFQVGYFLFSDFLSTQQNLKDNHAILMFIGETFAWHILLIAVGNVIFWIVLSRFVNNQNIFHYRGTQLKNNNASQDVEECDNLIGAMCKENKCEEIELESEIPA